MIKNHPGSNIRRLPVTHKIRIDSSSNIRSSAATHKTYKLLDLFCGEGLAAWGYWLSGRFSEIVGIDINPIMKRRYAFDFIEGDAMTLDYEFLQQFDFIHCSPPCQGYSKATPDQSKHQKLIPGCHLMCFAAGVPYVIENVEGSTKDLKPNLVIDGHSVGLPITRRRYFYVSELKKQHRFLSKNQAGFSIHESATLQEMIDSFGLNTINENRRRYLTKRGIEEGIPPAFTKRIAEMVIKNKFLIG